MHVSHPGLWALRMEMAFVAHTQCQACVSMPQRMQVTLTLRVSVRTNREEDGA